MRMLQGVVVGQVVVGSLDGVVGVLAVRCFCRQRHPSLNGRTSFQPPITVLKPVYGLEKHLQANLRNISLQEYPESQVIFCVQQPDDPALPLVLAIQEEFGGERVSVVASDVQAGPHGKVNNLWGGRRDARHDILVISDSDVRVRPDDWRTLVAPLAEPQVGCLCTLFKVIEAHHGFERLERLTMNADFIPHVIFAQVTGASQCCLGPSLALRRSTLQDIGFWWKTMSSGGASGLLEGISSSGRPAWMWSSISRASASGGPIRALGSKIHGPLGRWDLWRQ
jgi:ceramide glucosyltransferase